MNSFQLTLSRNNGKSKDEIFNIIIDMYNNLSLYDPYGSKFEIGQQCVYYKSVGWNRVSYVVKILEIDVIKEEILVETLYTSKPAKYLIKNTDNLYIDKAKE